MIVPGMSLQEIKKSLLNDYDTELRARLNFIDITYKRKWLLNGKHDAIETIHFPAKSKNNWRITVHCQKTHVHVVPYLISYNEFGIVAALLTPSLTPMAFMHFNTHFFQRYRERAKIKADKPVELVKTFFKQNMYMMPASITQENGSEQVFTPLNGGVGLGIYHEADDIYEFKTFVDNSLLKEEQFQKIAEIHHETFKVLTEAYPKAAKHPKKFY